MLRWPDGHANTSLALGFVLPQVHEAETVLLYSPGVILPWLLPA